jgi:hypothetical protein
MSAIQEELYSTELNQVEIIILENMDIFLLFINLFHVVAITRYLIQSGQ